MTRKKKAMTREYDSPWKEALERFFKQFLALLFPAIHREIDWSRGYEMLHAELEQIVREAELGIVLADVLVKVYRRDGEEIWVLIHVEVQAQPDARLPERMFVYHYRIFDRYHRPVVSLAVLADEQPTWRPDHYAHDLWGCRVQLDYPIVKLLDFQNQLDLLESNPNPFAPLVVAHLQSQATAHDPTQRMAWKTRLFRALLQRNLTAVQVRELLRIVDWFLELPPQEERQFRQDLQTWRKEQTMPFIPSFERFAREEGKLEGERKGLLRGIEISLNVKFSVDGLAQMPAVKRVKDPKRLQALLESIPVVKTLDEFRALLPGKK